MVTTPLIDDHARVAPGARAVDISEFFAPQRTGHADLPDPTPLLRNLTVGVLEALAGAREVEQLARWLAEEAFLSVVTRVNLAARARSARGMAAVRPHQRITSVRHSSPADGVVEGVVIVQTPMRTRAVAIRLEGIDRRWRATSLALL
ncbi:Rv3235 family protein [Microbacterium gorillae]|uniref:Rv3235 family protein n=1 Tax=Microbacterium gorillae TaxID=1231063 RepID=UPI00058D375B|nr:Rv3235 family protein [Microbacterium gorillae]